MLTIIKVPVIYINSIQICSKELTAVEAQNKFIHALDLVDLPKIISHIQAMRIYAKALKL